MRRTAYTACIAPLPKRTDDDVIVTLAWIRYLLVLFSFIATLILSPISAYAPFTIGLLSCLLLMRIREKLVNERLARLLLMPEAVMCFWLSHAYGGVLFLLFGSLLFPVSQWNNRTGRTAAMIVLWLGMNASITGGEPLAYLFANTLYGAFAFLLLHLRHMTAHRGELQHLYDELRRKHYELEEARKRIIEYAQKVENSAQIEERNRISRDLHDDLGHKLIRLKMMMEAGIQIFPTQPDKAMQMIHLVRDQLTDSMETLRATVRNMKPAEADSRNYSLDKLIDDLGQDSGIRVRYSYEGMPFPLYPSCEVTLYRNAQEAITNAIRHGGATEVDIHVRFDPKQIAMTVANNGSVPKSIGDIGLGISGMEERARLLGGELKLQLGDRFTATTVIPIVEQR
ncbi:sensor histidine kinase [Paenibacillus sp. MBLB4367]|uniref:sensor histidine kinase n=1 Tax=Paenibacillus sp. MBLB4367 TaxID=3384767 RepID=UPI0039082452